MWHGNQGAHPHSLSCDLRRNLPRKAIRRQQHGGATAHISGEGCGRAVVARPKQLRGEVCEGACRGVSEQEETLPQRSGDSFYFERYPSTPKSASAAAMKVSVKCVSQQAGGTAQ
jgi:hypothetical protein